MRDNILLSLVVVFVPFSLISVGGGPSILAGIQREAVEVHHWLNAKEFVDLFAIARAVPGPGTMLVTAIGWHVAGWAGALAATLALFVPSSILCYWVVRVWHVHRGKRWHAALERGLAPIGVGLLGAGLISVLRIVDAGWTGFGVTLGAGAVAAYSAGIQPILILLGGATAFLLIYQP